MTAQHFERTMMFTFKFFKREFHIISILSQFQKNILKDFHLGNLMKCILLSGKEVKYEKTFKIYWLTKKIKPSKQQKWSPRQVSVDGKLNSVFRWVLGCTTLGQDKWRMTQNISHPLLISQAHCSAIPMLNCSMQFHFSVTQRELNAITVNSSLWHRLPVHQGTEIFLPKQSSTTGIYVSPTLESNLVSGWSWGGDRGSQDVICEVCTTHIKENKILDERPVT